MKFKQTIKPLRISIKFSIEKSRATKAVELNETGKKLHIEEYNRIRQIPRFTPSKCILNGKITKFVDSASFLFMFSEIFEKEIYKFNSINKEPYILDCGANIGLSVLYFKELFINATIIAFEPDKIAFKALAENLISFGYEDVTIIQKALSINIGSVNFYEEGADGGRIVYTNNNIGTTIVETTSLKKYLNRKVDLLKIDIEGAEIEVLEDCKDNLENVERIFIEYHSFADSKQQLDKLLSILCNAGFRYYISQIGVSSPHPFLECNSYLGIDNQLNIFAMRNENELTESRMWQ